LEEDEINRANDIHMWRVYKVWGVKCKGDNPLGKPVCCQDIKMGLKKRDGMLWPAFSWLTQRLVQVLVKMVMNPSLPYNVQDFFSVSPTISYSKRTALHYINQSP
jgi:hypothetical protein